MAFSKQITSVKFDFYNTSTVASVASTTLSVNGIDFTKKMEMNKKMYDFFMK